MELARSAAIIFGFLALGEAVVYFTGIKFPSSVVGMLALTIALHYRWIKVEWVRSISEFLLNNLGLFFIPSCVGVMLYFDIIAENMMAIMLSVVISTVLVILVTGGVYQYIRKKIK